ncbi:hypothetical protein MTO96_038781 [Rhipicephalus appendiculatus]
MTYNSDHRRQRRGLVTPTRYCHPGSAPGTSTMEANGFKRGLIGAIFIGFVVLLLLLGAALGTSAAEDVLAYTRGAAGVVTASDILHSVVTNGVMRHQCDLVGDGTPRTAALSSGSGMAWLGDVRRLQSCCSSSRNSGGGDYGVDDFQCANREELREQCILKYIPGTGQVSRLTCV